MNTYFEVAGSIPGTCGLSLQPGPSSFVRTIGHLFYREITELIKKDDVNRFDGA